MYKQSVSSRTPTYPFFPEKNIVSLWEIEEEKEGGEEEIEWEKERKKGIVHHTFLPLWVN